MFRIAICDCFNLSFFCLRSFLFHHIQSVVFVHLSNGMSISRRQECLSMKYCYFSLFSVFFCFFSRKEKPYRQQLFAFTIIIIIGILRLTSNYKFKYTGHSQPKCGYTDLNLNRVAFK